MAVEEVRERNESVEENQKSGCGCTTRADRKEKEEEVTAPKRKGTAIFMLNGEAWTHGR